MNDTNYQFHFQQGGIADEQASEVMYRLMNIKPHKDILTYSWDDLGMVNLMEDAWGDTMRFSPQNQLWYLWDHNQWVKQDGVGNVIHGRFTTLLNLLILYCKEQKWLVEHNDELNEDQKKDQIGYIEAFEKFTKKYRTHSAIESVLKELKTECIMNLSEMDTNPYILNTTFAPVDLRTGEIVEDISEYNITKRAMTYPLDELTPECTRWFEFIDQIMSHDKEKAAFLQRALGYSLLGVNKEECMFIAYGNKSRNGKGTLFSAIEKVLGEDYYRASVPDLILERKNGGYTDFNSPQPALATLVGSRIVSMAESNRGQRLHSGSMKAMTGRDTLSVRGLYESTFRFIPEFTLWLNTNYLPAVTDETVFKSDRIWVITFDEHFDEDSRDTSLKEVFTNPQNQPTILSWLIEGARMYFREGLNPPEVVRQATANYQRLHDRIGAFIEDCCEVKTQAKTKRSDMYRAYRNWCNREENKFTPIGSTTFYEELEVRGYGTLKSHGDYVITDLELKETGSEGRIKL